MAAHNLSLVFTFSIFTSVSSFHSIFQVAVSLAISALAVVISMSKENHLFRIMDITESVTASAGDNAEFFCMVDANPMTADTVKWTRQGDGFDMESRDDLLPPFFQFFQSQNESSPL